MAPHKTITINGRQYDAITGLPVSDTPTTTTAKTTPTTAAESITTSATAPEPAPTAKAPTAPTRASRPVTPRVPRPTSARQAYRQDVAPIKKSATTTASAKKTATATAAGIAATAKPAEAIHAATLQHSSTLNRRVTRKPAITEKPLTRAKTTTRTNSGTRQMDIARSKHVTHFAPNPAIAEPVAKPAPTKNAVAEIANEPAKSHPVAHRALSRVAAKNNARRAAHAKAPKTAKQIKDDELKSVLAAPKPAPTKKAKKSRKKRSLSTRSRIALIVGSVALVAVVVALLVYRFVPTISVSIAASQAGISATYPEYTPDGYSLHQPVSYQDREVDLKFASNSNGNYYTITQKQSSWDSSAVLDNIVTPAVGEDYVTTKERGLTIYTYDSVAVWVNGGILYTIDSKAPLSGEQIRKIATSL